MLKISLFMKNNFFYGLALLTGIMLCTGCKKTETKAENINSVTLYDCAKKAGDPPLLVRGCSARYCHKNQKKPVKFL
jgi:hypothetical protein